MIPRYLPTSLKKFWVAIGKINWELKLSSNKILYTISVRWFLKVYTNWDAGMKDS